MENEDHPSPQLMKKKVGFNLRADSSLIFGGRGTNFSFILSEIVGSFDKSVHTATTEMSNGGTFAVIY